MIQAVKNGFKRFYNSRGFPVLVMLIMALLLLIKPLLRSSMIIGADSLFHFNRFYDTAEQFKTGHFSYFLMNYGFGQSGRIVNAMYGPMFAYLSGLLLLITPNWYIFEMVYTVIILLIAGIGMYKLCRVNKVSRELAMLAGVIFMYSTPVFLWVSSQQFTGVGAAFLPWLFVGITRMLRNQKMPLLYVSVSMAVLIQTHLLSSLLGFAAIIPIWIVTLCKTKRKWRLIGQTVIATILVLLLTANVWGGMLSVFSGNYLVTAFPTINLVDNSLIINKLSSYLLVVRPMEILLIIYVTYYLITRFKKLDYVVKTISIVGLGACILATDLFPWTWVQKWVPDLTMYLQFPRRIMALSLVMIILAWAMMLSDNDKAFTVPGVNAYRKGIRLGIVFLLICSTLGINYRVLSAQMQTERILINNRESSASLNHVTSLAEQNHHYYKNDFYGNNLSYLIGDLAKNMPDYVPSQARINHLSYYEIHPYYQVYSYLVKPYIDNDVKYVKTVNKDASLTITWNNDSKKTKSLAVPAVKYARTQVTFNGQRLNNPSLTAINSLIVKARPGKNQLVLKYPIGYTQRWLITAAITWLLVLLLILINFILRKRRQK